jgi:hypothetical protein
VSDNSDARIPHKAVAILSGIVYTEVLMQDKTRSPLRREFLSIVEVIAVLILCLVLTCQMETRKRKEGLGFLLVQASICASSWRQYKRIGTIRNMFKMCRSRFETVFPRLFNSNFLPPQKDRVFF